MPELARIPQVLRRNEHKYTREINACHAAMLELFGINPKTMAQNPKKKGKCHPRTIWIPRNAHPSPGRREPSALFLFPINIHPLLNPPPTAEKSLCFLM